MPQGAKVHKHRKKARAKAQPYQAHRDAKRTKKGGRARKAKTAKGRAASSQKARSALGGWVRDFEMMAARRLTSTGATLSMGHLKGLAKIQAKIDQEKKLTAKNKTRAAQVERKAARMVAAAQKELEELHGP